MASRRSVEVDVLDAQLVITKLDETHDLTGNWILYLLSLVRHGRILRGSAVARTRTRARETVAHRSQVAVGFP